MPNELENVFGTKIIPCPHCGTQNAKDAESCLLCGKPMQTASTEPADDAGTPDAPAADAPSGRYHHRKPFRRKLERVLWAAALVLGLTVLTVVQVGSPAHTLVKNFTDEKFYRFDAERYEREVKNKWLHQQIFTSKILDRFDEEYNCQCEILRTSDGEGLRNYIESTGELLRACDEPKLEADIRQKFDAMAAEVYADYLNSAWAFARAQRVMGWIVDTGYCSDETKANYDWLEKVNQMEVKLTEGKRYESEGLKSYQYAIQAYRQVAEHPKYGAEAQAAADRCLAVLRADALTDLRSKAAADVNKTWAQLKQVQALSPDDTELQQLCDQFDRYINHGLHAYVNPHGENRGFTKLFQTGTSGDKTVTDASGKAHDIFNLYKLQAKPIGGPTNEDGKVQLSAVMQHDTGITRLTFTVDPSAACGNGQAKIVVSGKAHEHDTSIGTYYTSPMLTKDSPTLTVDVTIGYDAVVFIELVCYDAPMEMLIDNAYVESYRPGDNK